MRTHVSIVIPCFNQGMYLSETLQSVLNQNYLQWECIIVNDGSTDQTEAIAKYFSEKDNRFIYIYQLNGGLSKARNTGISYAKGEFIQFLDSDDLLTPSKLETTLNFYYNNQDSKIICYSSMRYFENDNPDNLKIVGRNNFIAHIELKEDDSIENQKEVIFYRNPFVISACLYPSELFSIIGGFDEELRALEDWDFHIRCVKGGFKFHHFYDKDSLTLIRLHNSSMMRNQKLLDTYFHQITIKHQLNSSNEELKPVKKSFAQKLLRIK